MGCRLEVVPTEARAVNCGVHDQKMFVPPCGMKSKTSVCWSGNVTVTYRAAEFLKAVKQSPRVQDLLYWVHPLAPSTRFGAVLKFATLTFHPTPKSPELLSMES